MKPTQCSYRMFQLAILQVARVVIVAGFLFVVGTALSQTDPGGGTNTIYTPLETWSFQDHVTWTSDSGRSPLSFTNLAFSNYGNGASLVVDSNIQADLHYNANEASGATNFTPDSGTVMFWYAPASWASTNLGGSGSGDARLFEVGRCTTNSSYGWWSIRLENDHLLFSTQTNDLSGSVSNYIDYPISLTTNFFHQIALTYSPDTNTALYVDGGFVTNGPPLNVYPGPDALTNGFWLGSDGQGGSQARGMFNSVATYNVPLDSGTILSIFNQQYINYMLNPLNVVMFSLSSATSNPSFTPDSYSAITGAGFLQWVTNVSDCVYGDNALDVWVTNITATAAGDGSMNVAFSIEGGQDGFVYDVFATSILRGTMTNMVFAWLGQGQHCNRYQVNIPSRMAYIILGTPLDTNGDGVSDAYSRLIAHIDPDTAQTDAYGVPYAWYVQNGLDVGSALQDPDMDALLNYQEYLYGTRPKVSQGFSVWMNQLGTNSSLP